MKEKSYVLIDADGDGKISDTDIDSSSKIQELKEKGEKFEAQKKMAWLSLIGILFITLLLFLPFVDVTRVQSIGEFISMLYVSLSGIVAAYMGTTAWIYQKDKVS